MPSLAERIIEVSDNDGVRCTTLDLLNKIDIQQLKDKDPDTWEKFELLSRGFMGGIVKGRYRIDPDTAEDIYQKVFEKVMLRLKSYRAGTGTKFSSWLGSIVENTCKDYFRSEKRRPVISIDAGEDGILDTIADTSLFPSGELEASSTFLLDLSCIIKIACLHEEDEKIILLLAQGFPYHQIAKKMNLGINTVKSRIHRAREKLKKAREKLNVTLSGE